MALRVTLNVFSGRPDPTWFLDNKQTDDVLDIVRNAQTASLNKPVGAIGSLGYRGFTIEGTVPTGAFTLSAEMRLFVNDAVIDHGLAAPSYVEDQPTLEGFLLTTGQNVLHPDVAAHVQQSIGQPPPLANPLAMLNVAAAAAPPCLPCLAADAPPYAPGNWNNPSVQPLNNCYNYANDQVTNTFAQPGRASGRPITGLSCGGVQPSATSDGLVAVPNFGTPLSAGQGWYAALVIWPGQDFHWYRQDSVGCWSHKPGSTAARNTDQSGNVIGDPATANRGPYRDFCSYMKTRRGVTIR